jgi:gliding motility-associated-like protein
MLITRKLLIVLLLFVTLLTAGQAPSWQWALQISTGGNELAHDVCPDPLSASVYVCGTYDGLITAALSGSISVSGLKDGYLMKVSPTGTTTWAFSIGGLDDDEIKGVSCDNNGNIYVTGYFKGTVDFDPSLSTYYLTASTLTRDGFIAKYTSSGALVWAVKFGGSGNDEGARITVNGSNLYLTGYFENSATFYSTSAVTKTTSALGGAANFFGARYDLSGVAQWLVLASSSANDQGTVLTADNNRVYFGGSYASSVTVYDASLTTAGTLQAQTSNKPNVLILACNSNGSVAWITNASSGDDDQVYGITVDSSNVYIAGGFKNNTISFPYPSASFTLANMGGVDIYMAALSKSNGAYQWTCNHLGSGAADETAYAITRDFNDNLILSGTFRSVLTYTAFGGPQLTSSGNDDIFINAYTTSGSFLYATRAGGSNLDMPHAVASSTDGALYVAGEYANSASFGGYNLTNFAGSNIFVAKTGCDAVTNNTIASSQTVCASSAAATFTGSTPVTASSSYTYEWQKSTNGSLWTAATGSNNGQAYSAGTNSVTTYYRRRVITAVTCKFTSNTITVTVHQLPSTANAGSSQTVCSGSVTLTAVNPTLGQGSWSLVSGGAVLANVNSTASAVSSLGIGSNVFAWSVSNGVCPPSVSTVIVQRDALPTNANAGLSQTVCSSTVTLSGNVPLIGTGTWSVLTGGASLLSSSSSSSGVSNLSAGNNSFRWTISNGTCPPSTATTSVYRDLPPSVAVTSVSQAVCSSSVTIAANTTTAGSGAWSTVAGGGTIASVTSATTIVNSLSIGINRFQWMLSSGICPPSTATLTVQRDALPTVASVTPVSTTVCSPSVTLNGNSAITGSGTWSVLSGTATITSASSAATGVSGLSAGPNTFAWTITNGVCPPSTATAVVVRDLPPTTAVAGANQTVCSTNATITANAPVIGQGSWNLLNGSGTIASPAAATTAINSLAGGTNVFQWLIGNGVCPASIATVSVQRDLAPTQASASVIQTVCAASSTIAGNVPLTGTGSWSVLSGNSVLSGSTSATATVSNLSAGLNQFQWNIQNGTCPVSSATTAIFRDLLPTVAQAGSNQTLCSSSATLSGNAPLTGQGTWSVLSGNAVISSVTSGTTGVNSLAAGMNNFVWTISNGVCPSSTSSVSIYRDLPPSPSNAGTDQAVCSTTVMLNANVPVIGTGAWSVLSGAVSISQLNNPSALASAIGVGVNVLEWTITNGSCPAASSTVQVQRDPFPDIANAGTSYSTCSASATLAALSPTSGSGTWLTAGVASVTVQSPSATVTGLAAGINTFTWIVTSGVCTPNSATIQIYRAQLPSAAVAGASQTVCAAGSTLSALPPANGTGSWTALTGGVSVTNPGAAVTGVTGLNGGTNKLVWTVNNGICPPSHDTTVVYRYLDPDISVAGASISVCSESCLITANQPVIGNGSWSVVSGNGTVWSAASATSQVSNLSYGLNRISWVITNGICPPATSTFTVRRATEPSIAYAGVDQDVCSTAATLTANTPVNGSGYWTLINGSAKISNTLQAVTTIDSITPGSVIAVWTITNDICPFTSDTLLITRSIPPSPVNAGADFSVCGSSATLSAITPTTGSGIWKTAQGISADDINSPGAKITSLPTGTNILLWIVSNGSCKPETDTLKILSVALPPPANAGPDHIFCSPTLALAAMAPPEGKGSWSVLSGAVNISDPFDPHAVAVFPVAGESKLKWTVLHEVCPVTSDIVSITRDSLYPVLIAEKVLNTESKNVRLTASIPGTLTGIWELKEGTGVFDDPADPTTHISSLGDGRNVLRWTVSGNTCPAATDEVIINVTPFMIPNALTPNNDGVNDGFVIEGLKNYPGSRLEIYSRWGAQLYKSENYDNSWKGTNSNNEKLADDTYYYILDVQGKGTFTGFVIVKSN